MKVYWWETMEQTLYALDELERVVGGEALASSPSRRGSQAGGEWDVIYGYPRKTRRRLIGAGFMRVGGMPPDVLADTIRPRVPGCETTDDAMRWYVKTCLVALAERRILAHRYRHLCVARRNGHRTYYAHRTAYARSLGFDSVYDMRKKRGWT